MVNYKRNKETHTINMDPYDPEFEVKMRRHLEWRMASCPQCSGQKNDIAVYCEGCNMKEYRRSNGKHLIPENAKISITEKGENYIKSTLWYWLMKPKYEKTIKEALENPDRSFPELVEKLEKCPKCDHTFDHDNMYTETDIRNLQHLQPDIKSNDVKDYDVNAFWHCPKCDWQSEYFTPRDGK